MRCDISYLPLMLVIIDYYGKNATLLHREIRRLPNHCLVCDCSIFIDRYFIAFRCSCKRETKAHECGCRDGCDRFFCCGLLWRLCLGKRQRCRSEIFFVFFPKRRIFHCDFGSAGFLGNGRISVFLRINAFLMREKGHIQTIDRWNSPFSDNLYSIEWGDGQVTIHYWEEEWEETVVALE